LGDIAKALETKANARILMNDPEIADEPVSMSVHFSSLEKAMKIILNGFSYALRASAQGLTVTKWVRSPYHQPTGYGSRVCLTQVPIGFTNTEISNS
jgi:hypothetical protein